MAESKEYNTALEQHQDQIVLVFLYCKKFTNVRLIETQFNFKYVPISFAATSMATCYFCLSSLQKFQINCYIWQMTATNVYTIIIIAVIQKIIRVIFFFHLVFLSYILSQKTSWLSHDSSSKTGSFFLPFFKLLTFFLFGVLRFFLEI